MNRGTAPETIGEAVSLSREKIARSLSDTLGELEATIRKASAAESEKTSASLNQQLTRMRRFESDQDWCEAVLDAAALFCRNAALFAVRKNQLCYQGARGIPAVNSPQPIDLASAPGFAEAITKRAVVAAPRDPSRPIAVLASAGSENRAWLIPILLADKVPGVLYAEGASNLPALELTANFAASALECHLLREEGLAGRRTRARTIVAPTAPKEAAAVRSAQVAVANIILNEFAAVRRGRAERCIYSLCAPSIDAAREKYRNEHPEVPDYLHQEIVRTIASNQPELLGTNYPHPQS